MLSLHTFLRHYLEQSLLMDSAHSNRHQGFVEEPDPSLNIEDDDNDSSPF